MFPLLPSTSARESATILKTHRPETVAQGRPALAGHSQPPRGRGRGPALREFVRAKPARVTAIPETANQPRVSPKNTAPIAAWNMNRLSLRSPSSQCAIQDACSADMALGRQRRVACPALFAKTGACIKWIPPRAPRTRRRFRQRTSRLRRQRPSGRPRCNDFASQASVRASCSATVAPVAGL